MTQTQTRIVVVGAGGLLGRAMMAAHHGGVAPVAAVLDVTDTRAVMRAVEKADATHLVFAAAKPWVEGCEIDPAGTRRINVDAPVRAAAACARRGTTVVAFSSEYVFPGPGRYVEDDVPQPLNEYGRQKLEMERRLGESGRHLVLRVSGLYGPEPRRKNFVLSLWDKLARGERVAVPNDQHVTPTFTPSLAALVMACCANDLHGLLHLAGPDILDRVELARRAARVRGLDESLIDPVASSSPVLAYRAPRPLRTGLVCNKAFGLLRRQPVAAAGAGAVAVAVAVDDVAVAVDDGLRQLAAREGRRHAHAWSATARTGRSA